MSVFLWKDQARLIALECQCLSPELLWNRSGDQEERSVLPVPSPVPILTARPPSENMSCVLRRERQSVSQTRMEI